MATVRIPILGSLCVPDAGGQVFLEPYTIKATNDNWAHLVWVFNDTSSRKGLRGVFSVPKGYVNTANLIVTWTAIATTGDVEWDFDYRAVGGNDTESFDQATAQESVNANDTAPSAVNERMEISIALTDGNFAAGDTVQYEFFRDGSDVGDDMAAAALLFQLEFEYADA